MSLAPPPRLHITLPTREALRTALSAAGLGRYAVQAPRAGLLPADVTIGAIVTVQLEFLDSEVRFQHQARVADQRAGADEWIELEFLPDEQGIRELIECYAAGEAIPYFHRREERRAVWMPAMLQVGDLWRRGLIADVSEHGAFVCLTDPPAARAQVMLGLAAAGGRRVDIRAVVAYQRASGARPGCGLEFQFADAAEEARLAEALRAVLQPASR